MKDYLEKVKKIKKEIEDADAILIGAGAGLSTSAGILYSGEDFEKEFKEYIKKYHFEDLYSASFYDFDSEEEKWAFFAKFADYLDFSRNNLPLYNKLFKLVKGKPYFILSTNVDDQFVRASFDEEKVYQIQGFYSKIQCSSACHDILYPFEKRAIEMINQTNEELKIPEELVPVCPVCGETMELNLRKDGYFVQDDLWYKMNRKYSDFIENNKNKKVVLLELGVGFNTPGIIRFPFEQMASEYKGWTLVRINKDNARVWSHNLDNAILIEEDIDKVINDVIEARYE